MQERFQFLKTYADTLKELEKADENLAKDLAWKIIQYWIYDEDVISDNPIIEAIFIQIKLMIDNGKAISDKNKENWMKGWRPKNPNKTQTKPKQNPNESETKAKQNPNESEAKAKKTKIENRKDKKENNLISLSKDKEEEKSSYGDEEINECLEIIKSYNNGIINWSNQKWRQYSKHLISKLKKIENVKDWKIRRQDVLKMILEVWKENEYYSVKTTSPELIYYNLSTLMEVCRKQFKKQQWQKVLTAL